MSLIDTYVPGMQIRLLGGVKQYGSRTAMVRDRFITIHRGENPSLNELMRRLEAELAEAAGERRDNHTVYELVTFGGKRIYIMFHEPYVYFGLSVEEGKW